MDWFVVRNGVLWDYLTQEEFVEGSRLRSSELRGAELLLMPAVSGDTLIIPEGTRVIGDGFFANVDTRGITAISLPSTLEVIGARAFAYMYDLREVTIPASVREIGEAPFFDCGIDRIMVEEGDPAYASVDGVLFTRDLKQLIQYPCCRRSKGNHYAVPDGVEEICGAAFSNSDLISVELPRSLRSTDATAFSDCRLLYEITVRGEGGCFTAEDGVLYSADRTRLVRYPEAKPDECFVLPESVTHIDRLAFCDCRRLTRIIGGNGVPAWHASSFRGTEADLPFGVGIPGFDPTAEGAA